MFLSSNSLYSFISEIRFTENFYCQIEKGNIVKSEWRKEPEGRIEFFIPFAKVRQLHEWYQLKISTALTTPKEFFKSIMKTLSEKLQLAANYGDDNLEIEEYGQTDLDTKLDVFRRGKFPIRKVVSRAIEDYRFNKTSFRERKISLNYMPDNPTVIPLSVHVKVYDEREIDDKRNIQAIVANPRETTNRKLLVEVAQQIREQAGFEGALLIEFQCSLRSQVKGFSFEQFPVLEKFALHWPTIVPPHRLQLNAVIRDENKVEKIFDIPVTYDVDNSVVVWGGIPFAQFEVEGGEVNFHTWRMQLRVHNSVDLYNLRNREKMLVSGSLVIETPYLLSGVQVRYPNEFPTKVTKKTKLSTDLLIDLDDQFSNKVYSPYQHIQFPNVVFDEMRLADLLTLLQDMRFQTTPQEVELDHKDITRTNLITAIRKEGTGELFLWILAEGEKYGTKREKSIPGDEIYTTELLSGKTNIYIRGQLKGDTYRVVNVINEIHDRLKMRFRHVNTVE